MSLGSVYIPPLPMQAAASEPHPPASSGFSTPAVLRLINSSTESTGDPNILIFSNDDDVSGWNTVLVLSTSKDAGKAAAAWKLFNSALGAAAWRSSLHSVGHTGCETDALGVSPAYIVPAALDSITGFWFSQLLDTVFSTTSAAAATLACVAMNFSVVSGTQKYLSGASRLAPRTSSGHLRSLCPFAHMFCVQFTGFTKTAVWVSAATSRLHPSTRKCLFTAFLPNHSITTCRCFP